MLEAQELEGLTLKSEDAETLLDDVSEANCDKVVEVVKKFSSKFLFDIK